MEEAVLEGVVVRLRLMVEGSVGLAHRALVALAAALELEMPEQEKAKPQVHSA